MVEYPERTAAAADWLARLHADHCNDRDRSAFRDWLDDDVANADCFERMTKIWDLSGGLRDMHPGNVRTDRTRRRVLVGLIAGTAAMAMTGTARSGAEARTYRSGIGERRSILLARCIEVTLDTDTELMCAIRHGTMEARILRGQIALSLGRPDVALRLDAGACSISPLPGSRLDLRLTDELLSVTALDGAVPVSTSSGRTVALHPGERLKITQGDGQLLVDRPDLDDLAAWRSGHVVFRDTTLARAVAEMNRYSRDRLVLGTHDLGALRLSGRFRSGDNAAFARALTMMLPVRLQTGCPLRLVPLV